MSFLNNKERNTYLNILRPEIGYSVEYILGTTFSLDLDTLLMASLSLCLNQGDEISLDQADPIALLEGCRKLSEKSIILYEPGQIHRPKIYNQLYYFIEQSLYSVKASKGGVFHPKIWLVKYKNEDFDYKYRFICLSRNMTFDSSWDFSLQLNGAEEKVQSEEGKELSRFFSEIKPNNLNVVHQSIYDEAIENIKKVHFEIPNKLELSFYPLGLRKSEQPFYPNDFDRQCIVSPFLRKNFKKEHLALKNILVSCPFEIHKLDEKSKKEFEEILVINDTLFDFKSQELDGNIDYENVGSDLHAKMYFLEKGKKTELYLGSANATDAAFYQNIEFLVCLKGKTEDLGIDQFLNSEDEFSFRKILKTYEERSLTKEELKNVELEEQAFKIKKALFNSELRYEYSMSENEYEIQLLFSPCEDWHKLKESLQFSIKLSLLTRHNEKIELQEISKFSKLTLSELTSLFNFSIEFKIQGHRSFDFVQKVNGLEFPKIRSDLVIQKSIDTMDKFLRFLYLILNDQELSLSKINELRSENENKGNKGNFLPIPLFEEILKSLSRSKEKLNYIDKVIEGLSNSNSKIIPDEFLKLWKNVKIAKERLNG